MTKESLLIFRKWVALGLILAFICDPTSAFSSSAESAAPSVSIPASLGRIEKFHQGSKPQTVIYIQDAHSSLEAQQHIAGLVSHFVDHQGVRTVLEEGYEGEVPSDEFFGWIQNAQIKEKVAFILMDYLRLGGAEYAHITRKENFKLVGVDHAALHAENLEAYRQAARARAEVERDLSLIQKEVERVIQFRFPAEFKNWLKIKTRFDEKKISLLDYLKRTGSFLSPETVSAEFPGIFFILEAAKEDFPEKQPILEMTGAGLIQEIKGLEEKVSATLLDEGERRIFKIYQYLLLLQQLNQAVMTPAEFESGKELLKRFSTDEIVKAISAADLSKGFLISKKWEQRIQSALTFYETAEKRDAALSRHLNSFFETGTDETVAMVFGGFHREAIEQILVREGVSFYVVTPRITKPDAVHGAYYDRLMSQGMYAFEKPFLPVHAAKPAPIFAFPQWASGFIQALVQLVSNDSRTSASSLSLKVARGGLVVARSEMRDMEREKAVQDYFSGLKSSRASLHRVPDYLQDAFLNVTEIVGMMSRNPQMARSAREFIATLGTADMQTLSMYLEERLSGKHLIGEKVRTFLEGNGQEALWVVMNAVLDSNLLSPLRQRDKLPFAIHYDAQRIENYFSRKMQFLTPPLNGEVPVTDLWFMYNPDEILGLVAMHRAAGETPHAKGGIRYISPGQNGEYNHDRVYGALFGEGNNEGIVRDLFDLVRAQHPKNLLGTEFQGAKAEYTVMPGMDDELAFKKFGAVLVDAGIIDYEVPGPDVGMAADKVQLGVDAARRFIYEHLRMELMALNDMYRLMQSQSWRPEWLQSYPPVNGTHNPLLFYPQALEAMEKRWKSDGHSVQFLRGHTMRKIRMAMVLDYLRNVTVKDLSFPPDQQPKPWIQVPDHLAMEDQVFETTIAQEEAFYREIQGLPRTEAYGRYPLFEQYDPAVSIPLRKAIDRILGAVITGGDTNRGAISHVEAAVTGKGVDTALQRVKQYLFVKQYKLDGDLPISADTRFRVAINGAGDVGGSLALMAARRGDRVVAINDFYGVVYNPEGFSIEKLQEFNNLPPSERNVIDFFGSLDGVTVNTNREMLYSGEFKFDILVTAAMANAIHENNIEQLRNSGVIAVVEGGNNTYKRVAARLHEMGIVTAWGSTVNVGGVIASSHENQAKHLLDAEDLTKTQLVNSRTRQKHYFSGKLYYETLTLKRKIFDPATGQFREEEGEVTLHNGRVYTNGAGSAFADLSRGAVVDIIEVDGVRKAFIHNFEIGEITRLEEEFIVEVNGIHYSLTLINRIVEDSNAISSEFFQQGDSVEIVFPIRDRKYATYKVVEKTIDDFITLVLALQDSSNPERSPIHVQQALSKAIGREKTKILRAIEDGEAEEEAFVYPDLVRQRREKIQQLIDQGYQATPEEMMHIAAAELARERVLNKQEDGSMVITDPFTGQKIKITRDFKVFEESISGSGDFSVQRSEARKPSAFQPQLDLDQVIFLKQDVVFVIRPETIDALTSDAETNHGQWYELLGLKEINPDRLKIVVDIQPGSEVSPRVAEILEQKNVYRGWNSAALNKLKQDVPVIQFEKLNGQGEAAESSVFRRPQAVFDVFDGTFLAALYYAQSPTLFEELIRKTRFVTSSMVGRFSSLLNQFFESYAVVARSA